MTERPMALENTLTNSFVLYCETCGTDIFFARNNNVFNRMRADIARSNHLGEAGDHSVIKIKTKNGQGTTKTTKSGNKGQT